MSEAAAWDAVFWDIGGVVLSLSSVQRAHARFVDELCEQYPCEAPPAEALGQWRDVVGDYFADRAENAFRPAREGYDRAVDAIVADELDREDWRPLFHAVVADEIEPNPGAVETVRALQSRPVHVGVVSDVDHDEGRRILRTFDLFEGFDSYTTSEAVGHTKPHPAMFETALAAADVAPERAVMIGDRYRNDMEGANRAGLATIAYGAADGPAVDHRVETLPAVLDVVAGDDGDSTPA
jgi:putative hydrolase of the HAD superfamily